MNIKQVGLTWLVVVLLAIRVIGLQSSMTGAWTVTFSPPSGDRYTAWELQQHDDGTLTGEIELFQGSGPVTDGWVKDDTFGFRVTSDMRGQTVERRAGGARRS